MMKDVKISLWQKCWYFFVFITASNPLHIAHSHFIHMEILINPQ